MNQMAQSTPMQTAKPQRKVAYPHTWNKVGLVIMLFLTVGTVAGVIVFAIVEESFAVLVAFLLFGSGGLLFARRWGITAARLFVLVYCCSILVAMALSVLYLNRYGSPYYIGGSDDLAYEMWARDVVRSPFAAFEYNSIRGAVIPRSHNSPGYVYLVSLIYRMSEPFGGFHTMLPRFLNGMALALIAVMTWELGKRVGLSPQISTWVALFVGLLPIMQYTAAHVFRDIIVSALTLWVVFIWSDAAARRSLKSRLWLWVQTLFIAGITSQFRMTQAVAILVIALVSDLLTRKDQAGRRRAGVYIYFFVTVALLVAVFVYGQWGRDFVADLQNSMQKYTEYRTGLSDGLAVYVFTAPPPLTFVLRVFYALVTPLPVLSRDLDRLWLSVGTIVRTFFLPFLAAGLVLCVRDRSKWHLLSAFLILFGGMMFISFTSRHIVQFLPYGALIAGVGFEPYRRYRWPVWIITLCSGILLALAYVSLQSR